MTRTIPVLAGTSALFALWLVLSDKRDAVHLIAGLLGAAGVVFSVVRRTQPAAVDLHVPRFLGYLPWLAWQVLLSNLHVAKVVLSRHPKIHPRFLSLEPTVKDPRALTLLGASITLTPGTLTVDVSPQEIVVHALDDTVAADIEAQTIERKIAPLFTERAT